MKTETKTKKEEKPNKLEKLVLDITAPFKMNQEIELQQLAVFVGANSSGKSFMLKVAYALGAVGVMRTAPPSPNSAAQFVFDNTFTEQNFNGVFRSVYTKGYVMVELKDGKVISSGVAGEITPVTYMSADMRLFDNMVTYLRLRKKASKEPLEFMKTMLEAYRLYNFSFMESFLVRLPLIIPDSAKSYLDGFDFPDQIASIEVDKDKCEFTAVLKDGKKKNISTYGAGHQAVLSMLIGGLGA
jgi:hypothetical protein